MRIALEASPRVSLALQQQGVPFLHALRLENASPEALDGLEVSIASDPPFLTPHTWRLDRLEASAARAVETRPIQLAPSFLAAQAEREDGYVEVVVRRGGTVIAAERRPVEVLAPTQWTGIGVLPELLAAFVRPNARVLAPILQDASSRLASLVGDGSLCGYQKRDPAHAAAIAQALWEAVQASAVTYINPPASFEQGGQKIRTHEQVVGDRLGTCLDLTVLLAALFEQAGLNPVLVVVQGHAFPGVWLTPFELPEPLLDDPLPLRKRVELGEALVVDSSPVTGRGTFAEAAAGAERQLATPGAFVLAIDVAAARHAAAPVRPLPLDRTGEELARAVAAPSPAPIASEGLPAARFARTAAPAGERVVTRLDRWQQRLLDLSLRNRLLHHRTGPKTLAVPRLDVPGLEDQLASGAAFTLVSRPAGGLPVELPPEEQEAARLRFAREQQAAGRLVVDLPPADLDRSALELFRLSRSALEETGANVLYLALGFLRWFEAPESNLERMAPLVLVPVELVRPAGIGGQWLLRGLEDETRVNVTLVQKLQSDFGLDVTGLGVLPADGAGLDVAEVLRGFRRAVLEQRRWEVVEAASIATFSFAKFLMWLDLSAKREALLASPVVRRLVEGDEAPPPSGAPVLAEADVAAARPPHELYTVVDADPSQLRAVIAAEDGHSFVLQGPPGTGKSQTITNLVAQLVARGKTVLFVSEKLAALEVVHTRLARAGLGPFCLELHSDKATRGAVARQLAAPFELARQHDAATWQAHADRLVEVRDTLDRHAQRLGSATPFGVPLRAVVAELVGLGDVPRVDLPGVRPTTLAEVRALEALVERLEIALREAEPVADHPFDGVGLTPWTPAVEERAMGAASTLRDRIDALVGALGPATEALRLPPPGDSWEDVNRLVAVARGVIGAPADVPRALLDPPGFDSRIAALVGWVERGRAVRARRDALLDVWRPSLFDLDLDALHARYARWAGAFFLFAWFALWPARRLLGAARQLPLPGAGAVVDELATARWTRDETAAVGAFGPEASAWLGPRWRGVDTDWDDAAGVLAWARAFHATRLAVAARLDDLAPLDRAVSLATDGAALVRAGSPTRDALAALVAAHDALAAAWQVATEALAVDPSRGLGGGPSATRARLVRMLAERTRLRTWCHVVDEARATRGAGLGPLLDAVLSGTIPRPHLARVLARALREAWWRDRLEADRDLAQFSGFRHAEVVARFRELDERALKLAQAEIVRRLVGRLPELTAPGQEMELVRRQIALQRRHLPPRKLFEQLPTVLKRIKPVVLMSPQSVSRFLDPRLEPYDVVVFDEASQIPPWDAVGAIARGRQAIIVGDSKQLPPTSFFDRAEDGEETEVDDEAVEELESILDEATASNLAQLQLRWHYRSRHESLITFSNRHYYDNRLHTFPSADAHAEGVGLELRRLPPGSYDRGGSRTNRAEAEAVVAELERQLDLPDDLRPSIGVVTFSMAQQRLVEDLTDSLRQRRPELDRFFLEAAHEHVFVKNLENVQGDERDVMLFSIGYGSDRNGKLTMSFGPVNRKGGERRLNVAITRARSRLIVFSSLDPDQIDLNRTSAVGARHLRAFLRFARDGVRALDAESLAEGVARFESPFEQQVHDALVGAGLTVHSQVGCSGYRIDLAVVDPELPGRYLLGVECDGAAYHGSRSARERDRLRQAVLENLGWRMIRVWSTDWWFDPAGQTQRLLEAVGQARRAPRGPRPPSPPPPPSPTPEPGPSVAVQLAAAPARPTLPAEAAPWSGLPPVPTGSREAFHEPGARAKLAAAIAAVVEATGPVQRDAAWRHVAHAWGMQRLGERIVATLDAALASIPDEDRPRLHGDFLWPAHAEPAALTRWRPSETGARPAHEVAPEELGRAAAWVVGRALSIDRDTLVVETARLFGWKQAGRNVAAAIDAGLATAVRHGWIRRDGDLLRAAD